MANDDRPVGFRPVQKVLRCTRYVVATSQTIAIGDAVILSSNLVQIALSTSGVLLGVAATAVTSAAAGAFIWVWDHPEQLFVGQCSGDSTDAGIGDPCDIEGTTGIMEVNENASTEDVIVVRQAHPDDSLAANGRVYFQIQKHVYANSEVAA